MSSEPGDPVARRGPTTTRHEPAAPGVYVVGETPPVDRIPGERASGFTVGDPPAPPFGWGTGWLDSYPPPLVAQAEAVGVRRPRMTPAEAEADGATPGQPHGGWLDGDWYCWRCHQSHELKDCTPAQAEEPPFDWPLQPEAQARADCGEVNPSGEYVCVLAPDHDGQHVAKDVDGLWLATWAPGPAPTPGNGPIAPLREELARLTGELGAVERHIGHRVATLQALVDHWERQMQACANSVSALTARTEKLEPRLERLAEEHQQLSTWSLKAQVQMGVSPSDEAPSLQRQVEGLSAAVKALEVMTGRTPQTIDNRMRPANLALGDHSARLDVLESRVDPFERAHTLTEQRLTAVDCTLDAYHRRLQALERPAGPVAPPLGEHVESLRERTRNVALLRSVGMGEAANIIERGGR